MSSHTREPIISVLGHVDSGKTTLLDYIRGSVVASREAGGITQHIGATDVPFEAVREICGTLLDKIRIKINLRGLLFIDTPGHEAFTTLRKRGGSVSDLAVLVVDLNEGLMPQSIEAIEILRHYKTPFVVAANKVDAVRGWIRGVGLNEQPQHVRDEFYKKFYGLVGQISEHGFDSDLYSSINDFSKQIAIVPTSAKTGEGVPELMMVLMGLAQQYLAKQLSMEVTSPGKGTILEVKEETGLGTTIDVILYDGIIRKGDPIVVGSAKKPIVTKVKALLKPKALDEMRDPRERFKSVDEVYAAYGVKIVAVGLEGALAGAPVYVGGLELVKKVMEEIGEVEFSRDSVGVIVKADTLGALEALMKIMSDEGIPVRKASIGRVSKQDVVEASTISGENKFLGVVLAFNSSVLEEANDFAEKHNVRVFTSNIIYRLIEDYMKWVKDEREQDKLRRKKEVVFPAKFTILPKHVFRQSKPAIVGIEVLVGKVKTGCRLMRSDGKVVGIIREMQSSGEKTESASAGDKVAISVDDVIIGRHLFEGDIIYPFVSFEDMARLKPEELSDDEKKVLKEIRDIIKHK